MTKKSGAIPLSTELIDLVKQRQLKLIEKRKETVTLTEVSNEIVTEGLKVLENKEE